MSSLENFSCVRLLLYRFVLLPLESKDRLSVADAHALELLEDFAEDVKLVRHLICVGEGRPRLAGRNSEPCPESRS